MKTIVLLTLLSISIVGTYYIYNYSTSEDQEISQIFDEELNNPFQGYEWELDVIQRKEKQITEQAQIISHSQLEEQIKITSLKMSQVLQIDSENDDFDKEKLQFIGKIFGFVSSKLQSLTRVLIPAVNLMKNTLDTLSSVVHQICNPQGAIEGFIVRAVKTSYLIAAKVCQYNQYYGKFSRAVDNFKNNVSDIIGKLQGRGGFSYQYISESYAQQRLFTNLEGLYGSLGARLQCIDAAKKLRKGSYNLAKEVERNLDRNSCSYYQSGCTSVDSVDFDQFDSNWYVNSEYEDIKEWGEYVAYYTQFVEYCKYKQFYLSEQDLKQ